jgi:hypothetical protein
MGPLEMMNPGQGRTGAARVNRQIDCFYPNRFSAQHQAFCRLTFLQSLIGPDFELILSLRLDAAHQALEAQRGGPDHVGTIAQRVMANLARRSLEEICCE